MLVIKRDGTKEEFSFEKIHKVLSTVLKEEERTFDKLDKYLKANLDLNGEDDIEVDEIHSTVEQFLMKNNYFDAARAYIQFRYKKALDRAENQKFVRGISKKLMAEEVANSNANLDENSFGGRLGEAMRFVAKDHALNYCMSKKSKMNHINNEIYIHK